MRETGCRCFAPCETGRIRRCGQKARNTEQETDVVRGSEEPSQVPGGVHRRIRARLSSPATRPRVAYRRSSHTQLSQPQPLPSFLCYDRRRWPLRSPNILHLRHLLLVVEERHQREEPAQNADANPKTPTPTPTPTPLARFLHPSSNPHKPADYNGSTLSSELALCNCLLPPPRTLALCLALHRTPKHRFLHKA